MCVPDVTYSAAVAVELAVTAVCDMRIQNFTVRRYNDDVLVLLLKVFGNMPKVVFGNKCVQSDNDRICHSSFNLAPHCGQ